MTQSKLILFNISKILMFTIIFSVAVQFENAHDYRLYVAVKVIDRFSRMAKGNTVSKIDSKVNLLTEREKDICRLLGDGKNNREIADELYLSEGTVKNHITNILNKLELRDRTQLALFAVKNGLC